MVTSKMKRVDVLYFLALLLFSASISHANAQRASISLGTKLADPGQKKKRSSIFASAADIPTENDDDNDVLASSTSDEEILTEAEEQNLLQSCEVAFENIKIILRQKGKKPDRIILDGSLKGAAKPGRMLAVMGPSGSGKSSLVHAIAGRIKESKKITLSGQRYVNGEPLSGDSNLPAAFIEQEVIFFPHMTVKETLDFRVELKLGKKLGKSARDDVVDNLMDLLGLTKSANTIVGNAKVRGLSGGERKRLSIACELISSPPVIILDEPTSGLDSYQAAQVTGFLRKLADSGKTIIAVIHQPSQSVFSMFDDLLLISEGRQMYYGEVSKVRPYLSNLGYPCSKDTGTAEHVLDCISRTNGGSEEQKKSDERIHLIAAASESALGGLTFGSGAVADPKHHHHRKLKLLRREKGGPPTSILRQFRLLLSRSFKETTRGKTAIIIKIVQQVTLAVVYGGIYKVGDDQASIMDRFGLLSLVSIGGMNMAIASTIRSFTKEKSIVSSEMASGMYRTFPYFFAKAISEIPLVGVFNAIFGSIIYPLSNLQKGRFKQFLGLTTMHTLAGEATGLIIGAISPNADVALSLFPPLIVLNIIFDGRNISEENTPVLMKWLPKASLVRWAFEGLSVNEFTGLTFTSNGPRRGPVVKTGSEALERFGFADTKLSDVVAAQRNIITVCWLLSYLGLSLTKSKFESMGSP